MMRAFILLILISNAIAERLGYAVILIWAVIIASMHNISITGSGSVYSVAIYFGLLTFFTSTLLSVLVDECCVHYGFWIFGLTGSSLYGN